MKITLEVNPVTNWCLPTIISFDEESSRLYFVCGSLVERKGTIDILSNDTRCIVVVKRLCDRFSAACIGPERARMFPSLFLLTIFSVNLSETDSVTLP